MNKFVFTLSFLLLCISCKKDESVFFEKPFTFKEAQENSVTREIKNLVAVDSLNLSEREIFNASNLIAYEGSLFFLQSSSHKIWKYNQAELKFMDSLLIPKGRGPGEIEFMRNFDLNDGTIVIPDDNQKKLAIYSILGEFQTETLISEVPMIEEVRIAGSDKFLIESTFTTDSLYHMLDKEGMLRDSFQSSTGVDNAMAFTGHLKVKDNYLIVAGYSEPIIKKYDLKTGSLIFSREIIQSYETTENYMSRGNAIGFTKNAKYASLGIDASKRLIYSSRPKNEQQDDQLIDVYEFEDGDYRYSYILNNNSAFQSLAINDKYLYSIEIDSSSNYWLMKYKMES